MNGKKVRTAVVLGVLLVLVLGGEAGARERAAVSARKYVTIPGGHFHPNGDGYDWHSDGRYIEVNSGSNVVFIAPVVFPGSGPVTVRKVTLYARDNNASSDVGVSLYKTNPLTGGETAMASAWSSGASATDPREFSTTDITYATIQRAHGAYLWLRFTSSSDLRGYAVKIAYTD